MSGLSAFLSQNAIKVENVKYVVSNRFIKKDGTPEEWEIRAITGTEDAALRKECTKQKPIPGRKNLFQPQTDYDLYLAKLAVHCTVYPNLNDKELQDSYGVMGAEDLIVKMLTPGEYSDFLEKIQQVNGFDKPFDELVEEAKN